ncbi:MAG: HEAT repeat domain-containing protein [bacterium]|nr:HEAT repeat domain-containing protein [bacterium]
MSPARRAALVAAMLLVPGLPHLAGAQVPAAQDGRQQMRDRFTGTNKAAQQAKLDEAVRKFQDEDLPTRLEGVGELGIADDRAKAIGYLMQGLTDDEPSIRLKSIDTLGSMRAEEAIPSLVQLLFLRDTDATTKRIVLVSLGKIGSDRATRPVLDFLARDNESPLAGNAIFSLGEIGDPIAIPALEAIAARETATPQLRTLADASVRKIKERPAPEVIPPALVAERRGGQSGTP